MCQKPIVNVNFIQTIYKKSIYKNETLKNSSQYNVTLKDSVWKKLGSYRATLFYTCFPILSFCSPLQCDTQKEYRLCSWQFWVKIQILLFRSCVILSVLLNVFVPQFLCGYNGHNTLHQLKFIAWPSVRTQNWLQKQMNDVRNVPGTQLTFNGRSFTHTCLVIFDWLPDIVNFTLLGAGYFCVPLSILGFYYVIQLSYLEIFCELLILI